MARLPTPGSDTILNPIMPSAAQNRLVQPYSSITLRSNASNKWIISHPGEYKPVAWWTHPRALAIPNNTWTPLAWGSLATDPFLLAGTPPTATTTIASGSNGVVLPQSTINVASTSGFASTGWCAITGPPGSNVDTIFRYTGTTSTSFTGCNTGSDYSGLSTGTMATN